MVSEKFILNFIYNKDILMGSAPVRPYVFVFNYDWFLKIVNTCPIK